MFALKHEKKKNKTVSTNIIFIQGIKRSILSLSYLVKSCNSVITGMWIEKEGNVNLIDS